MTEESQTQPKKRGRPRKVKTVDATPDISASITFTFDENLGIKIDSKVREDFVPVLIKNGVIDSKDAVDQTLLHYALILLVNEASDQVISNLNDPGEIG